MTKNIVAWIVSYEDVLIISQMRKDEKIVNTVMFIIFSFIFYFLYKNLSQQQIIKKSQEELSIKTREQELLLSLFDKENSVLCPI